MKPVLLKPVLWFRLAAVLLLLFAAGHTYGFLVFRPATAEGQAVWAAMGDVHFREGGSRFSYRGFYTGFGLLITAFQLFTAWLAWVLGAMVRRGSVADARPMAWGLAVLQVVGVGLSLRYFAAAPAVFSGLTAVCLGTGAMTMQRAGSRGRS